MQSNIFSRFHFHALSANAIEQTMKFTVAILSKISFVRSFLELSETQQLMKFQVHSHSTPVLEEFASHIWNVWQNRDHYQKYYKKIVYWVRLKTMRRSGKTWEKIYLKNEIDCKANTHTPKHDKIPDAVPDFHSFQNCIDVFRAFSSTLWKGEKRLIKNTKIFIFCIILSTS